MRVGLIAAAALICALVAAGCSGNGPAHTAGIPAGAVPPVHLGGRESLCPAGHDLAAVASSNTYYPASIQIGSAITRSVTACFATERAAHDAGFHRAALPAHQLQFGPVILGEAPMEVRRVCVRAEAEFHRPLLCPSLLPTPWTDVGDCPSQLCTGFEISGMFPAAHSYLGVQPGTGHVNVWAVAGDGSRGPGCPTVRPRRHTIFHGHKAALYWCPRGSNADSGHVLLVWHQNGMTYGVSAHGHTALNERLVLYLADHLAVIGTKHSA